MDRVSRTVKEHHYRKPITCPWCHHGSDVVSGFDTKRPSAGEPYVCMCGRISIFVGTSELRKAEPEEAELLATCNPTVMLMLLAWRKWNEMGRPAL